MNVLLIILLACIAIAVIVGLLFMTKYNGFVHLKALVDEGWSGIDVQLKRRYDLIPNLVSIVKGYSIHEKTILEDITRMRAASMGATQIPDKVAAEAGLTKALHSLFAVVENYPQLKANENFLALQKELSTIENEIQLSRRYYNGAARNYNIAITQFPAGIIAPFFGFSKITYFELAAHERDVPKIHF